MPNEFMGAGLAEWLFLAGVLSITGLGSFIIHRTKKLREWRQPGAQGKQQA